MTGELDHPNIVPDLRSGPERRRGALLFDEEGQGTPWSKVIGEKSLLDNLTILMKVADAVAFAHARGVVHRDLKPENVMLGDFGEVLVLDWGLAVATEGHRPTPNVSAAFNIAGTPAYMAPELAIGPMERIGRHSDIYLLGAILYEIVTGQPPHTGKNARDCLKAAAKNEIVPTEKRGELVEIARKAMATEPAERHASVQAFQEAIRDYQAHTESIALGERAEEQTAGGRNRPTTIGIIARSLFAFEEACSLWSGNEAARAGVTRAKLHYAGSALGKHDFDLGLSLARSEHADHAALHGQLTQAKQERDARQKRLKRLWRAVLGLAAPSSCVTTVGIVLVTLLKLEADRQADSARKSAAEAEKRGRADQRRRGREEARTPDTSATEADGRRESLADKAAEARAAASASKAEYEAYAALIAMAGAKIDENAFDQARQALAACQRRGLRGWEWRRLMYVVEQGRAAIAAAGPCRLPGHEFRAETCSPPAAATASCGCGTQPRSKSLAQHALGGEQNKSPQSPFAHRRAVAGDRQQPGRRHAAAVEPEDG